MELLHVVQAHRIPSDVAILEGDENSLEDREPTLAPATNRSATSQSFQVSFALRSAHMLDWAFPLLMEELFPPSLHSSESFTGRDFVWHLR
jgi:hypothetical protein